MAADPKTPWVGFGVGFGLGFGFGLGLVACVVLLWGEDFKVASVVLVLVAVGVVHVELGLKWNLGVVVVVVVVGCELAVEVRCGDGVALAGLVVAKPEVRAIPGDRSGGSKDGVRVEVTSELGWVWMFWSGFGGVGER